VIISNPGGTEVVELRQKFSKTFDMGGGQFQSRNVKSPAHWDNAGSLEDVDLTVIRRGQNYELKTAPYTVTFRPNSLFIEYDNDAGGVVTVALTHVNDTPIGSLGINITPRLEGNRVYLDDFLPDVTLYLQANDSGFSFQKLITANLTNISFTMEVTTDDNPLVRVENRALGRDNFNQVADPDRITSNDTQRQIVSTETVSNERNSAGIRSYTLRQEWTGGVARVDPVTRIKSVSQDVIYPVRMHVLVQEVIGADADDGDETNGTTWSTRGVNFRAGRGSTDTWHGGLHFTTVAIPQGATIDDATLGLEVINVSGVPQVTVYGDDIDDAAAIGSSNRPSQWTKTTASADATTAIGTTGARTLLITSVIQEIVDRAGWATGQDMNLGLFHDGGGAGYQRAEIVDWSTWGNVNYATLDVKAG